MGLKAPSKLGAYIELYIVPLVKTNMTLFLVWRNISRFSRPISTLWPETKPKTNKTWFSCRHGWWIQNQQNLVILVFHIFMVFLKSFLYMFETSATACCFPSCAASQDLCSSPTTLKAQAAEYLGQEVHHAVITVPAFFTMPWATRLSLGTGT